MSILRFMPRRPWLVGLLVLSGLLGALWPQPSYAAGCSPLDVGACMDGFEYSFWSGVASVGWTINRTLLQLAYQLTQFRWWVVDVAFSTAYQLIVELFDPLYVPVAILALTLGCLLFMLVPITGQTRLISLRHVLVWTVLTPVLITVGGQLIGQAEQVRSTISTALFLQASAGAPGALFGVSASDMAAPTSLYPANPCGGATLTRRGPPGMLQMDDLAAALLYADAEDIHCPDLGGPSQDLPDAFFAAPPSFATTEYVAELLTPNARRAAVEGIQRGVSRLYLGILPSMLAVAEALIHLTFALSLVVLWLGLPIGLVFVFFQQTAAGVTGLFRRAINVFQVSWSSSFLMGLLFSCLLAAAQMGNATAYTGFAIGGLLLLIYLALIAFATLRSCMLTLGETLEVGTGSSVRAAEQTVTTTVGAGVGAAVGAAALGSAYLGAAAVSAAGASQTGSVRYGAAALLGRSRSAMAVGEVATAMGWMADDGLLYRGMRAGERSTHSLRAMRLQVGQDATQLRAAAAPTAVVPPPTDRGRRPPADHADPPDQPDQPGAAAPGSMARGELTAGSEPTRLPIGEIHTRAEPHARVQAEYARAVRSKPALRDAALQLDAQQHMQFARRLDPPSLALAGAVTMPQAEADLPGLLLAGYAVQPNPRQGTVSYWLPAAGSLVPNAEPASRGTQPGQVRLVDWVEQQIARTEQALAETALADSDGSSPRRADLEQQLRRLERVRGWANVRLRRTHPSAVPTPPEVE
ncbi:MAG: hypothetical protein AB4911_15545 [Oscillochloridaceae bacterium umkhey_bin13]